MPDRTTLPAFAELASVDVSALRAVRLTDGTEVAFTQGDWVRFYKKITEGANGCWAWRTARSGTGYGNFDIKRATQLSHRVAYMLFVGEIPAGLQLDHLCRNPPCCNPAHLEPVTPAENTRRRRQPQDRLTSVKDVCVRGHSLAGDNVYVTPSGRRSCRACSRERDRGYRKARSQRKGPGGPKGPWTGATCSQGHELSDDNIYTDPRGRRECRMCRAISTARWRAAKASTTSPEETP